MHRQLLRRFAQQELENADQRRKLLLRNRHITQLEDNARVLSEAMQAQAVSVINPLQRHIANQHEGRGTCVH